MPMLSFAMVRYEKELQIERQLVVVPSCCDHYESEAGQREFAEWKAKQEAKPDTEDK